MGAPKTPFPLMLAGSLLVHGALVGGSVWITRHSSPPAYDVAEMPATIAVEIVEPTPAPEPVRMAEPTPLPTPVEEVLAAPSPPPAIPEVAATPPQPTPVPTPVPKPKPAAPAPKVRPAVARLTAPAQPAGAVTEARADYRHNPPPDYPEVARRRGWEGTVLLRVEVTAAGRVAGLRVARGSGRPMLDQTALRAVRHWRFSPRKIGGVAVAGTVEVPVTFQLRQ